MTFLKWSELQPQGSSWSSTQKKKAFCPLQKNCSWFHKRRWRASSVEMPSFQSHITMLRPKWRSGLLGMISIHNIVFLCVTPPHTFEELMGCTVLQRALQQHHGEFPPTPGTLTHFQGTWDWRSPCRQSWRNRSHILSSCSHYLLKFWSQIGLYSFSFPR